MHPIDRSLLVHRLKVALALRERLSTAPYYRLVFGEADGLPGLVLDRYGDVVVGQIATAGMEALRADVEAAVADVLAPETLVWKNDGGARDLEQLPRQIICADRPCSGGSWRCIEAGYTFAVPLAAGQKTGWFYDQTANRDTFRRLLWPGARVLDVCSYAGAWAITAMRSGAREAVCVDSSAAALAMAAHNATANGVAVGTRARRCLRRARRADRAPASASTSSCSTRRPSSRGARTYRVARRPTASSTSWRCGCWSATACW